MIDNNTLKQRVIGRVRFSHFQADTLWYLTDDDFIFPIPVSETRNDTGGAPLFNSEDKAIYFMRWIRKQMEHMDALVDKLF